MIKEINVSSLRGISSVFKFKKVNVFTGENGTGKSTLIDIIKDIHKGQTSIKEGTVTITNDDGTILQSLLGTLPNKNYKLGNNMELMTPGFFLNGRKVKGVNETMEDKRSTISNILGINRDEFFINKGVDYSTKGLIGELRDMKVKETTYAQQLIEAENKVANLITVLEPKKVILSQGNKNDFNILEMKIKNIEEKLSLQLTKLKEPQEVILVKDILTQGNESELNSLQLELEKIKNKGINKKSEIDSLKPREILQVCNSCGQEIKDSGKALELATKEFHEKLEILNKERNNYVIEYKKKGEEIKDFNLIKTEIIKGNESEYMMYKNELERVIEHNKNVDKELELISELRIQYSKLILEKNNFILKDSNEEAYNIYNEQYNLFQKYISDKENIEGNIKELMLKISALDSASLEEKIKKYRDVEKEFIESIKDKLKIGDFEIMFYRELETPNSDGDMFKTDFDLLYKGKSYNECSGGEKVIIDILLAKLFINHFKTIDFILIDAAELSDNNLKILIQEHLTDLQVIASRIGKGELTLKYSV